MKVSNDNLIRSDVPIGFFGQLEALFVQVDQGCSIVGEVACLILHVRSLYVAHMTHQNFQLNRVVISNQNIWIVVVRIMFFLIVTDLDILARGKRILLGDVFSIKVL